MVVMYKWLPIIFGCHCRDDRSFHYKGKKFPICARCTGELVGMIASIPLYFFIKPDIVVLIAMMIPMILDGLIQNIFLIESDNVRRFLTGILFGYSLITLFIYSNVYVFNLGYNLVK